MTTLLLIVFLFCYIAIVFEHKININKTASALIGGVLLWVVFGYFENDAHLKNEFLAHHFESTAQILFFLIGAMTIVELIDAHNGFNIITQNISAQKPVKLFWIIALLSFFMSAVLDNLTTAIVMITLLRKLVPQNSQRLVFAVIVIVAANAGGAWSPIGDVTTTMLWIGGQISPFLIIKTVFLPSLASVVIPVFLLKNLLPKQLEIGSFVQSDITKNSKIILAAGILILLFVPIFKTITHYPPYLGILFGLGILWVISEMLNKDLDETEKLPLSVGHALSKIDTASVLFFLGILLAIGALDVSGILGQTAQWMNQAIGNQNIIAVVIGLLSAIVDNVPLVAASQGMYSLTNYPLDSDLWHFLAYCAGTGGSILIIGSAAGVAVMGLEKINFMTYMKKFSWAILIGYLAGAAIFVLLN